MLALVLANTAFNAPALRFCPATMPACSVVMQEDAVVEEAAEEAAPAPAPVAAAAAFGMTELQALAREQNPAVGFWDPLRIAGRVNIFEADDEASIGFLRHAEIKHGRVAMAGFIGYIVHETGARWPFAFEPYTDAAAYYAPYEGLSAPAVWAALPEISKVQIILGTRAHESPFLFDTHTSHLSILPLFILAGIGALEFWGELEAALEADGQKHYMKGGTPGYYPSFAASVVPLRNLWDPIGFTKWMDAETRANKRNMEVRTTQTPSPPAA